MKETIHNKKVREYKEKLIDIIVKLFNQTYKDTVVIIPINEKQWILKCERNIPLSEILVITRLYGDRLDRICITSYENKPALLITT